MIDSSLFDELNVDAKWIALDMNTYVEKSNIHEYDNINDTIHIFLYNNLSTQLTGYYRNYLKLQRLYVLKDREINKRNTDVLSTVLKNDFEKFIKDNIDELTQRFKDEYIEKYHERMKHIDSAIEDLRSDLDWLNGHRDKNCGVNDTDAIKKLPLKTVP